MPLNRGWHFIFRFAFAGFLIAALAAFCIVFPAPNIVTNLLILASPGIWLFPHEAWGNALQVWFSFGFLALANGLLYAIVGAVIAVLTSKTEKKSSNL